MGRIIPDNLQRKDMEMNKDRIAKTIIEMTKEAVDSGNEKLYWQALGYVEGMKRSGEFTEGFAEKLFITIKDEWSRRRREKRRWFKRIWKLTA